MAQKDSIGKKLMLDFSENYMEKLFYFCLKKTGNDIEAEDLASDISLNILTSLERGAVPSEFSAWVWKIARNRYSIWTDKKHRTAVSVITSDMDDLEIYDENANILDKMIHSDDMSLLRRELAFISSDYRNIVVSYYLENKKLSNIAASLNLSEGTVASKLHRAKKKLKEGMSMAREFGKRSYNPDKIFYTNVCDNPGKLGQPWTLMDPKLNQNVFIEGYDNLLSAEEYALEMGVALPYMEDILEHLTRETLLVKRNNKYETAFPIISCNALQRIHKYYSEIMPRFVSLIEEDIDRLMEQFKEAGLIFMQNIFLMMKLNGCC